MIIMRSHLKGLKMLGIFKKTFNGLKKTRKKISNAFTGISKKSYLDSADLEMLEDCLFEADISFSIIDDLLNNLKAKDSSD